MPDVNVALLMSQAKGLPTDPSANPLLFSDNIAVAARIADFFILPYAEILDLGCGAALLREAARCTSYIGLDIEPRSPDIIRFDLNAGPLPERLLQGANLVVMMQIAEYLEDPLAVMSQVATAGKPLLCSFWTKELVREHYDAPADWRREFTIDSFAALSKAAGFDDGFRAVIGGGQLIAHLLFPVDRECLPRWWSSAEAKRLIKRGLKRGERQFAKYVERRDSGSWNPSRKWDLRADYAAAFIPKGLAIMDVGCGSMYFEKSARPCYYLPVDIEARDERMRVHNLDDAPLPSEWIEAVDLVSFLGVFEYVTDPAAHLRHVAAHGRPVLCTYNVAERRNSRSYTNWVSTLDTDAFEQALTEGGFTIVRRGLYGGKQMVWLALPDNMAEPPAWWSALPESLPASVAEGDDED